MLTTKKSFLSFFLSFCLVFSLISTILAKPAEAKTVRIAVVSSLSGDVTVQKGGGSQRYDAYEDMSLNQGDSLYTGSGSSATLNLSSGDGDVTIGENAEINVSDLSTSNGAKKSKLKIWAGAIWVKVKSLAGSDDEFEVETPTAVMGVRGTQLFVAVDPRTQTTKMAVGAGKVAATTVTTDGNNKQSSRTTFLYPTQQISLNSRDEVEDLKLKVDFMNLDQIIQEASPKVIEAMIKAKAESDRENDEFIAKKKKEMESGTGTSEDTTFVIKDQADLDKVMSNFRNLIGAIAKKAVESNKIDKSHMDQVIAETNKKIDDQNRKLDLDKVKELDKHAGVDPEFEKKKQQALNLLEAKKKLKEKEEADELARLKQKLEAFIKAMEAAKKKVDEANKQARKETDTRAAEELKKQKQQAATEPTPQTNNSNSGSSSGGSSGGDTGGGTTPTPKVTLAASGYDSSASAFDLQINMSDFTGTNDIYAVEVHLRYGDASSNASSPFVGYNSSKGIQGSAIFDASHSADFINEQVGSSQKELIYAITNFGSGVGNVGFSGTKTLVTIPFHAYSYNNAETSISVESITIARKDANNNVKILNIPASSISPITISLNAATN
ncbi:FecR domain-containing protein [Paenibacillus sp. SI8]|uniref:FecR family protein n=1 Tax=unclassified Paenibacillus TaxID=185978 RepID=UPI00346538C9